MFIKSKETFTGDFFSPELMVDGYKDTAANIFLDTANEIRPQALAELSFTPGPSKRPVEWQTPRQRMAYYASDGFGRGIPTVRRSGPGNIQESWLMIADVKGDDFNATIGNKDPGSKYVYGSLGKSNPGRFQQKMHINTGWPQAFPIVNFWLSAFSVLYRENLRRGFRERVRDFKTRKRAYTAPRRRSL